MFAFHSLTVPNTLCYLPAQGNTHLCVEVMELHMAISVCFVLITSKSSTQIIHINQLHSFNGILNGVTFLKWVILSAFLGITKKNLYDLSKNIFFFCQKMTQVIIFWRYRCLINLSVVYPGWKMMSALCTVVNVRLIKAKAVSRNAFRPFPERNSQHQGQLLCFFMDFCNFHMADKTCVL